MGGDEYYAEQSADEIFSGPTHELVPSSYSSFHHHHWPQPEGEDEYESEPERRDSLRSASHRNSFASAYATDDEQDQFQFFSRDEISHAEGASTVFGDDDSVNESFAGSDAGSIAAYSDDEDEHHRPLLEHHHRPVLFGSERGSFSGSDADSTRNRDLAAPEYPSRRLQQRYYFAEEDMRIVCAGYSIVAWKLWLYRLACLLTGGALFVVLRWFPRHRLALTARATPLGQCDLLVIENQWGELEQVHVDVQQYNHALSTIFNLPNIEKNHQEDAPPAAAAAAPNAGELQNGAPKPGSRRSSASSYVDTDPNVPYLRAATYRHVKFIYNPVRDMFYTNMDWVNTDWNTVERATEGLDGDVHERRALVFGRNCLYIPQPPTLKLLMDEVLHPFYIFQVFSIILWSVDEYLYYATAIFVISVASIAEALMETKQSMRRLADIAQANSEVEITVLRSGYWTTISSQELVPGDVYELSEPSLSMIPVDSMLLSGDCIVNESILTGESVPVSKLAATDKVMQTLVADGSSSPAISRSFLYVGTKIIRVRKPPADGDDFQPALAMAVRTGFNTTKGALVRSMMFPKPSTFSFYRDSFRYISVMAVVALFGFSISAVNFVRLGMDTKLIVLRALDIVTVVVPPALPATLTTGTNFSLQRLRRKQVFCITPSRVNVGGRVNVVAFDKTGTLTEEGLDVLGVHLVHNHDGRLKFGSLLKDADELEGHIGAADNSLLDTLVTCHELKDVDGELMGDPLDLKMFEFTQWAYHEHQKRFVNMPSKSRSLPPPAQRELQVYKHFEFVSQLRRMSVIASSGTTGSSGTRLLAKGAPEIMREICKPETLPMNFDSVLHQYTHRGYRVIACAWREIGDISDYDRTELESDLTFAGLIVFENKLKPESRPAIDKLRAASVRTIMCTGDNMLTAVSVGRECGIVPKHLPVFAGHFDASGSLWWEGVDNGHLKLDPATLAPLSEDVDDYVLAVTGDVFSHVVESGTYESLDQMLLRGVVYARMSPDEKHELVTKLQQIDYTACFCGDGANDCGALKGADVGISLSEAEASVAAPFTSRRFNISCVLDVLAEGRCALTTSFGCFKYMSMYSAIQFVSVTLLYMYGTNIGDFQFLWIDLFLIVPIAAFMAWSGPASKLERKRPSAELVSREVLVPLLSFMVINGVVQFLTWRWAHGQPWYVPPVAGDNDNLKNTDNTVLFFIASFQYISAGYVFCDGPPFRVPFYRNKPFLATMVVTILITLVFMVLDPASALGRLMDLTWVSTEFDLLILLLAAANLLAMMAVVVYLVRPINVFISRVKRWCGSTDAKPRYREIMETRVDA